MNNRVIKLVIVAGLVLAGAAGGYWYAKQSSGEETTSRSSAPAEKQPLFYRNPMNPEVTSPVPAKDSMGMDYIPVYADADHKSSPAGTVSIDPVTLQNIGVRSVKAELRTLSRSIKTVGRVDYDEQQLVQLHPKTEGWVEQLYIDETGAPVQKGAMLLSLYSPQLVATQQEYVLARKNLETLKNSPFPDVRRGAEELVATSLDRLRFLDVPDHQIAELTRTLEVKKDLHIQSPENGIIVSIGAREGQYVTPQTELYAIADLSKVWVYVDIYEDELPWVKVGDQATLRLRAFPGKIFQGVLNYIYPYADNKTRTIKARMEFDNTGLLLKPDMYGDVIIAANAVADVIAIPTEAVTRSGTREQVYIVRSPGKFEPRDVTLGISNEGWTEIRTGVAAGDEVVVSAQFLIDSESKLREATAKMQEVSND